MTQKLRQNHAPTDLWLQQHLSRIRQLIHNPDRLMEKSGHGGKYRLIGRNKFHEHCRDSRCTIGYVQVLCEEKEDKRRLEKESEWIKRLDTTSTGNIKVLEYDHI